MANTNPTTVQRNMRLLRRLRNGFKGYTIAAPALGMQPFGVDLCITPITGMAHGRIVSISREYPPPKKR